MENEDHCRCHYCSGTTWTEQTFRVITQMGREVDVVFNFCPNCGRDMRQEVSRGESN